MKQEKTMRSREARRFQLSLLFCLLNFSSFAIPVTGYSLKNCRINYDYIAICSKSKLKAVPQDIPSRVRSLDLSENKISKIRESDFKHLPNLTNLNLKGNNISKIDKGAFTNLNSLKCLNLNNNKLVQLQDNLFHGLSNLTELRLTSNHIKTVASSSFQALTNLKLLDLSINNLQCLTRVQSIIQHLPRLQDLSIKQNNLSTFQSWELSNKSIELVSLDLSQNPFDVFRLTADVFPNLTLLNLGYSGKKHPMIWDVQNRTFLRRVSKLDISGIHLSFDGMKTLLESVNSSLTFLRMNEMKGNLGALINISCKIPSLSTLQLQQNPLKVVTSSLLQLCVNVTDVDLAHNHIQNLSDNSFRSLQQLRTLNLKGNRLSSVPGATRNLPTLVELDLSFNQISALGCHDFANLTSLRELSLQINSISTLKDCVFKDLNKLQSLKLQTNSISNLNGAFKKYLPNLKFLYLNENELTTITQREFASLQSLQSLALHQNQIKTLKNGAFIGLTNLVNISLESNKLENKEINAGVFSGVRNLRRLNLMDNHIKYNTDAEMPDPPFSQLTRLETLLIKSQHYRLKSHLPRNFLQGLTNLLVFNSRNIQITSLHLHTFNYTPQLIELDLSSNTLTNVSADLFSPIQNLEKLYMSTTNLRSLDFFLRANLTKLGFLQVRKNAFSVISESEMQSLPALNYLDMEGNSFTCNCDNAWFLQWVESNNQTQVHDAYNFECNYPSEQKGTRLLDIDVHSCSLDAGLICYSSTTCMVLLFLVVSFIYDFLRWQLVYAYYLLLALLFDTKKKNKQAPNQYDAFVSYNVHDETWVFRELLPKLEGEQGWRLCLHHRDFQPGKPIIDNITDAIYGSRKTICVISHRYLESEWCSREMQVASFRLFDEKKDVLILVFLEEISTSQLSPYYRMRKLLKRRTYLSWPRAQQHTGLFWEKLRRALETTDHPAGDNLLLTNQA
ncbi:uncharacterized protein LOC139908662 [Centroberyx gerrardi]